MSGAGAAGFDPDAALDAVLAELRASDAELEQIAAELARGLDDLLDALQPDWDAFDALLAALEPGGP